LRIFLTFFAIIICGSKSYSQQLNHDIGFYAGYASMQTDYGQRYNTASNIDLTAASFSIAHSLYFYDLQRSWLGRKDLKNHILLRTSINLETKRDLYHNGKWANGTGITSTLLRAMKGSVKSYSAGIEIEYHFRDLSEFNSSLGRVRHLISPYISTGVNIISYQNTLTSDLGDWMTNEMLLPEKYRLDSARKIGKGNAIGLSLTSGIRFNILRNLDIDTRITLNLYNSDFIDGINADVPENKYKESLTSFQIGIIYRIRDSNGFKCF